MINVPRSDDDLYFCPACGTEYKTEGEAEACYNSDYRGYVIREEPENHCGSCGSVMRVEGLSGLGIYDILVKMGFAIEPMFREIILCWRCARDIRKGGHFTKFRSEVKQ